MMCSEEAQASTITGMLKGEAPAPAGGEASATAGPTPSPGNPTAVCEEPSSGSGAAQAGPSASSSTSTSSPFPSSSSCGNAATPPGSADSAELGLPTPSCSPRPVDMGSPLSCASSPCLPPSLQEGRVPVRTGVMTTVIRHGEGEHNVNTAAMVSASWNFLSDLSSLKLGDAAENVNRLFNGTLVACRLHDPPLTDTGVKQATRASEHLSSCNFDAVYVSPMLRTIETALHIFGGVRGLKLYLHPGCCETRTLLEVSNAGRMRGEILQILEQKKRSMGVEAEVDACTYLPDEPWWVSVAESRQKLDQRAVEFQKFLLSQEHRRVAVVSHATFLRSLTQDELLETCEWKTYRCLPQGLITCKPERMIGSQDSLTSLRLSQSSS